MIKLILALYFIAYAAIIAGIAYGIYTLATHPEAIGAFFGRIASGFEAAK